MTTFLSEWTTLNAVPFQSEAAQYNTETHQSANAQYNTSHYASENVWTSPRSYKLPGGYLVWTIRLPDGESRTCAAKVAFWYSGTVGPYFSSVNLGGVQDDTARGAVVKSPYWGSPHGYMTQAKEPFFTSVAGDIALFTPIDEVMEEGRSGLPSQYAIRRAVGAPFDRNKHATATYLESGNVYYHAGGTGIEISSSSSESSSMSNVSSISSSSFSSRSTNSETSRSSSSSWSSASESSQSLSSKSSSSTEILGAVPTLGLVVWLDADDRATVNTGGGGAVNKWYDKSPLGAVFSPSTAGRPAYISRGNPRGMNGRGVVMFRPSLTPDPLLSDNPPGIIGEDFTMFVVLPSWTPNDDYYYHGEIIPTSYSAIITHPALPFYDGLWIFKKVDGEASIEILASINNPELYTIKVATLTSPANEALFIRIRTSARSGRISVNDSHYNFTSPLELNWSSLGLSLPEPHRAMTGKIAEIIAYNRRLSNAEFSKLESYLYTKWGMDYPSSSCSTAAKSTSSHSSQTTVQMSTSSESTPSNLSSSLSSSSESSSSQSSSSESSSSPSTTALMSTSSPSGINWYYAYCEWEWVVGGSDPNNCAYYQSIICSDLNPGGIKGSIIWYTGGVDTGCFRQEPTPDFPFTVTKVRRTLPFIGNMPQTEEWLEANYPQGSQCCFAD